MIHVAASRLPSAAPSAPEVDPDVVAGYLDDVSGSPPGRASGLLRPTGEAEAADWLRATSGRGVTVLPQAARSSLTSGAVPNGEVVVSVERLDGVGPIERDGAGARCLVSAGVRLSDLAPHLAASGYQYPPVPTYTHAMVGGTVSTNAGGAATFRYGQTRRWVDGLRVLLANGDLLAIERGEAVVDRGASFGIRLSDGRTIIVPTPDHRLPDLLKVSAGYYSGERIDLVDLFVGAEGTLGLITAARLRLVPRAEALVAGLLFSGDSARALAVADSLRGVEGVRAIEWIDGASLGLLRNAPEPRPHVPPEAAAALLFELELDRPVSGVDDEALAPLVRLIAEHRSLDELTLALPGDERRRSAFAATREAVPQRVGEIVAERGRVEPGVTKVGGDLSVPFDAVPEMLRLFERGFERRGLEHATWGHLGDGNMHPNALPRNAGEVATAVEAQLEFAGEAIRRDGCPLAEHGVGRSPLKQALLRLFLGDEAVERMRVTKAALDPEWRFAPGVLFPRVS